MMKTDLWYMISNNQISFQRITQEYSNIDDSDDLV